MFDKNLCLIVTLTVNTIMGHSQACQQKNISCSQIKTAGGFNFQHDCPGGSEITVLSNTKTVIGHGKLGVFNHTGDVREMTTKSVTTSQCKNLTVTCIVQGEHVTEKCWNFAVTVDVEGRVSLGVEAKVGISIGTIAIIIIIIAIIIIAIIFFLFCNSRTRSAVGVSHRHLMTLLREGISNEVGHREELVQLNEITSAKRCENGQTGNQHNSAYAAAAGEAEPQSVLDPSDTIQMSQNGYIGDPDVKETSHHRAMHRNTREDPGGVIDGDAIHLNMTDTKAALVNGRSFNPDPVSRCSTARN